MTTTERARANSVFAKDLEVFVNFWVPKIEAADKRRETISLRQEQDKKLLERLANPSGQRPTETWEDYVERSNRIPNERKTVELRIWRRSTFLRSNYYSVWSNYTEEHEDSSAGDDGYPYPDTIPTILAYCNTLSLDTRYKLQQLEKDLQGTLSQDVPRLELLDELDDIAVMIHSAWSKLSERWYFDRTGFFLRPYFLEDIKENLDECSAFELYYSTAVYNDYLVLETRYPGSFIERLAAFWPLISKEGSGVDSPPLDNLDYGPTERVEALFE